MPRRSVHLVPTGRADLDRRTEAALARFGLRLAAADEARAEAVVSLLPNRVATDLARRHELPLLVLAVDAPAGPRTLSLPAIAAAGRSVAVSLLAVMPSDGAARRLRTGAVKSSGLSPYLTLRRILETCADWPARVLGRDRATTAGPALGQPHASAAADWLTLPLQVARNAVGRVREALTEEIWAVGIAPRPIASFLTRPALDDVAWLPERSGGGFLADPFGLVDATGPVILAEAFDPRLGRGEIVALRPESPEPLPVTTGLAGHLSYPCLVEDEGVLYCVPENSASGRVTLLRAVRLPERFEPAAVLLDGFAGVDCTPFRHDGRWWMLAMDHADQDVTKLFLFHADRLLGPWQPHAGNPVRCDVRSARPAGPPFVHDGRLYRPAQDCSERYGGAVVLLRIDVLTPERFEEIPVARIEPDPAGPYPDGVHTLTPLGPAHTLVDGKRTRLKVGR